LDTRGKRIQEVLAFVKDEKKGYGKGNRDEFVADVFGGIEEALAHAKEKKLGIEESKL